MRRRWCCRNCRQFKRRIFPLTGTLSASVNGEGTLDDPQFIAVIQLPHLQVQQSSISGVKAELNVAHHYADLNLNSQVSEASVRAHGRVALSGNYYAEAVIDTNTVPLDVLLATYAPGVPKGFQGRTELHATLKGPLKDKSQVEAHLQSRCSKPVISRWRSEFEARFAQIIHIPWSPSNPQSFKAPAPQFTYKDRYRSAGRLLPASPQMERWMSEFSRSLHRMWKARAPWLWT